MLKTFWGTKEKMGQGFVSGFRVPLTWVKLGNAIVTAIKEEKKDGYWAVQLGFGQGEKKKLKKSIAGHLKPVIKLGTPPLYLREVRFEKKPDLKVGDVFDPLAVFKVGDLVSVTGISKGKGFAGVVKRWKFAGGPKTHGQSDRWRAPGSIGQGTTPGRVHRGKKMAGRMGSEKTTIKNLVIVSVNKEEGMIALSGPLPGRKGGLLMINKLAAGKLSGLIKEGPQAQVVEEEGEEKEINKTASVAE